MLLQLPCSVLKPPKRTGAIRIEAIEAIDILGVHEYEGALGVA